MNRSLSFFGLAAAGIALAACSGGGGGGGGPTPVVTPGSTTPPSASPVLVPGTVAQYSGSDTITHVYPSPTGTQSNSTAGYTFVSTRTIENSASGAPAPYDVNSSLTYTVTRDPGQGVAKQTDLSDTYDNQVAVSGGVSVQTVGSRATTTGIDESAGAGGGGPFTLTAQTSTTYSAPQIVGVYPLVPGATLSQPIGRTVTTTQTDQNGGTADTETNFTQSSTDTVNSDGSYSLSETISNGQAETIAESANGSATIQSNGPVFTLDDEIGVPENPGSGYVIPVMTYRQNATTGATPAPTATTLAYTAADWYPGAALPASPFQTDDTTVRGAATLPSACAGAIPEPNLFEIDTSATTLNVDASYSTTSQQRFDSNGTPVCVLRTVTTDDYSLTTGALTQMTNETYSQVLTSLTAGSAAKARVAKSG